MYIEKQTSFGFLMQCTILELGKNAKKASLEIKLCSNDQKNAALSSLIKNISKNKDKILEANNMDIENGKKKSLSKPLINRLTLTDKSIEGLIKSIEDIITIPDPIGLTLEEWERPNGLKFRKISTPLGVLGVIYESRPNVTVDASCLSIKSVIVWVSTTRVFSLGLLGGFY